VNLAGSVDGNAKAEVVAGATQVGGVDQRAALFIQLGHQSIPVEMERTSAVKCLLKGVRSRGVVGRVGESGYVGLAGGVHNDGIGIVIERATHIGGVHQGGVAGIQLGYENVVRATAVDCLEGPRGRGKVCGVRIPCDIGRAGPIDRDGSAGVEACTAQIGGIDQGGASSIQLRDEGVIDPFKR